MIQEALFKRKIYKERKVGKMDLLHRLPQIIVISACITSIHTQCDESSCTCHCWSCSVPCTSCAKGWSGTTANYCQRKNVAYKATVASSSTEDPVSWTSYDPENAVDEDTRTSATTKSGKDPWLTVRLSEYLNISRISVYLEINYSETYEVYVTDSLLTKLPIDHFCGTFYTTTQERIWKYVKCSNERVFIGNKIMLRKKTNYGRLIVYEIQIFKCSQGTYGPQCENECRNCQDNRCHEDTGVCEVGCKSGWYGDKCDRECPSRCAFSSCDRNLGCTNCLDAGYSGPNCDPCSGNTYGRNCSMTCQNCIGCDRISWCQQCVAGFYGAECTDTCEQGCKYNSCEKISGNCVGGCRNGYMGLTCAEPCRGNCATCTIEGDCLSCVSGKFGMQCEKDCPEFCGGDKRCNKNTGNCSECSSGRFDPSTEVCSTNCLQTSVCLRNGDCLNGCVNGWIGPRCDMQCSVANCEKCMESSDQVTCEICNDGYFLDNTRGCQKCPSNCVSCENDLRCNQCIPGFIGSLCNEECNTNCIDGLCSVDGSCTYGCNNAKYGIGCGRECRDNCVHCFSKDNCTKCLPGFYGLYCQKTCENNCYKCTGYSWNCGSCKAGFYGMYCSEHCPEDCETCESPDRCSSCKNSLSGPLCQCHENCEKEPCGENGKCLSGCKDSFYGDYCNVTCPLPRCQKCDQSSGMCKLFSGEDRLPEDVHAYISVPLAVAFALVCLVSLGLAC
ncbi:uncharacterized protein LOC111119289 isoform X1 [Crassostrea virginica]